MPAFHLIDPDAVDLRCIVEIRSIQSKAEALGTLKRVLSPELSQHIECVQLFAQPNTIARLGAFVTLHTQEHASRAAENLKKHANHQHVFGAQLVGSNQQPGYFLPPNLTLPARPFSNFTVTVASPDTESPSGFPSLEYSALSTKQSSAFLHASRTFAVLNVHGFIDQAELEHILRLRVTPRVPIVCVQVWRARSSQSLHAYITFMSRSDAQWAGLQLHGRKGSHSWLITPLKRDNISRCARPPTAEERAAARIGGAEDLAASLSSKASNSRMVFSPTAAIIPFYASLLPCTKEKSNTGDHTAPTEASLGPNSSNPSLSAFNAEKLPQQFLQRQVSEPAASAICTSGSRTSLRPSRALSLAIAQSSLPQGDVNFINSRLSSAPLPQVLVAPATPTSSRLFSTQNTTMPQSHCHDTQPTSIPLIRAHSHPAVPTFNSFHATDEQYEHHNNLLPPRPNTARGIVHCMPARNTLFADHSIGETDSSFETPTFPSLIGNESRMYEAALSIPVSPNFPARAPSSYSDRENRFDPFGSDIEIHRASRRHNRAGYVDGYSSLNSSQFGGSSSFDASAESLAPVLTAPGGRVGFKPSNFDKDLVRSMSQLSLGASFGDGTQDSVYQYGSSNICIPGSSGFMNDESPSSESTLWNITALRGGYLHKSLGSTKPMRPTLGERSNTLSLEGRVRRKV
ncbi:hypothetical protein DL93DRAFT_2162938 [Clavulina sp. PMI_390]|nr:hypothetical protein DL93DRAFT_2162938 [Clavulina sp. PMI_390]